MKVKTYAENDYAGGTKKRLLWLLAFFEAFIWLFGNIGLLI